MIVILSSAVLLIYSLILSVNCTFNVNSFTYPSGSSIMQQALSIFQSEYSHTSTETPPPDFEDVIDKIEYRLQISRTQFLAQMIQIIVKYLVSTCLKLQFKFKDNEAESDLLTNQMIFLFHDPAVIEQANLSEKQLFILLEFIFCYSKRNEEQVCSNVKTDFESTFENIFNSFSEVLKHTFYERISLHFDPRRHSIPIFSTFANDSADILVMSYRYYNCMYDKILESLDPQDDLEIFQAQLKDLTLSLLSSDHLEIHLELLLNIFSQFNISLHLVSCLFVNQFVSLISTYKLLEYDLLANYICGVILDRETIHGIDESLLLNYGFVCNELQNSPHFKYYLHYLSDSNQEKVQHSLDLYNDYKTSLDFTKSFTNLSLMFFSNNLNSVLALSSMVSLLDLSLIYRYDFDAAATVIEMLKSFYLSLSKFDYKINSELAVDNFNVLTSITELFIKNSLIGDTTYKAILLTIVFYNKYVTSNGVDADFIEVEESLTTIHLLNLKIIDAKHFNINPSEFKIIVDFYNKMYENPRKYITELIFRQLDNIHYQHSFRKFMLLTNLTGSFSPEIFTSYVLINLEMLNDDNLRRIREFITALISERVLSKTELEIYFKIMQK